VTFVGPLLSGDWANGNLVVFHAGAQMFNPALTRCRSAAIYAARGGVGSFLLNFSRSGDEIESLCNTRRTYVAELTLYTYAFTAPTRARKINKPDRIAAFVGVWPCYTRYTYGDVSLGAIQRPTRHRLCNFGANRAKLIDQFFIEV
jgi:hypothetical protein